MVKGGPIDFTDNPTFDIPGWPVSWSVIDRYYNEATGFVGLPNVSFDAADWDDGTRPIALDPSVWNRHAFHFPESDEIRHGRVSDLESCDSIGLERGWTAVELESTSDRITSVVFALDDGSTVRVRPRLVVLALGGIENSRFLLNAREAGSIFDPHDMLGRFYMDHPCLRLGYVEPAEGMESADHYDFARVNDTIVLRGHDLVAEWARDNELLRFSMTLVGRSREDATIAGTSLSMLWDVAKGTARPRESLRHGARLLGSPRTTLRLIRRGAGAGVVHNTSNGGWSAQETRLHDVDVLGVETMFEQRPSPDNRVRLSRGRDSFGRPRATLQWSWSRSERDAILKAEDLVRQSLGEAGEGAFVGMSELGIHPADRGASGFHQIGGTRMSVAPDDGSVDEHSRYHGVDNLFIAGSSVFPSSVGFANPTLTLIATSLRLGDHLGKIIGASARSDEPVA
jgi:choline dehydrogenase-like flavoprotein